MSRVNMLECSMLTTHEGGRAAELDAYNQLTRTVSSCFLWENTFYENGEEIATRITRLVKECANKARVRELAMKLRTIDNLRHAPLWMLCALAECGEATRECVAACLRRADEPGELIAMWWKGKKRPIPASFKRGICDALARFTTYQLAKYANTKSAAISLRDVLRLVHPIPTGEQKEIYAQILDKTAHQIDTWESELSAGKDKCEVFTRLLNERKLGALALLRNLRNMTDANVDAQLIAAAILNMKGAEKILPFRYIAAYRAAPQFERELSIALDKSIAALSVLKGTTCILVDVSGSMGAKLSARSDLNRVDAACSLAAIWPGHADIYSFSNTLVRIVAKECPFETMFEISSSQPHRGTYLWEAVRGALENQMYTRVIVITDEQTCDNVRFTYELPKHCYMINVGSDENGVALNHKWVRMSGFSENVLKWISIHETTQTASFQ